MTETRTRRQNGTNRFRELASIDTAGTVVFATGGYYGSKMLYDHLKGDLTKPAEEGTVEKVIRDFPELPSLAIILVSPLIPQKTYRKSLIAGAGVNLVGHLLDRFQKYRKPTPPVIL